MTYRQLLAGNADFRRLWSGQVVSEIGDWLNNIAVMALTIQLAGAGHEGRAIALYAIARHLPLFLFGPMAGVVVDRADRRRVMIAADVLRALLALGFFVADRFSMLSVIYAVGAALFSVSAFFNAAKRASIPNIVGDTDELLTANSLTASTTAATIAVGSALGGLVSTFAGRDLVFILNALTFLVSAEMIRRIRTETQARGKGKREKGKGEDKSARIEEGREEQIKGGRAEQIERDGKAAGREASTISSFSPSPFPFSPLSILRRAAVDFREGLRYVRSDGVLSLIFIVAAAWGLGSGAGRAVYSLFGAALGVQTASEWVARPTDFGISVLFVAMGFGGVLGAPLARRINQAAGAGLGAHMGRSMILDGLGLALFSFIPNLWGAAAMLVAREVNFAIWWTAQQTIMMKRTEDAYAGRVFASYETLMTLMMVGAMFASGAAADTYGIRIVALGGGLVITLSGFLWFLLRRTGSADLQKQRARAEDFRS
ncbi:MAG TPA: MFS transporter [Pyrinomonadaceae bacterium]